MSKGDMDSDIPKTASAEKMHAAFGRIRNQPADAAGKFPVFVG